MGRTLVKNWSVDQGCRACSIFTENGSTLHHLYTRKSRADLQMKPWNLIPCCQMHHNEFHSKGTSYMAEKYVGVKAWLVSNGWEFDEFMKKWRHPGATPC